MVHDQIDIPLCEKLKAGAFRQNHPEHRVCLLQSALLPALHRVTVINAGTLYSVYTGLQSIRVTKFRAPSVRIYSNTEANSKVPIRFSRRSKTRRTAPFVHRFIRKARKSFSLVKNIVSKVFFDSWTNVRYPFEHSLLDRGNKSRDITGW